MARFDNAWVAGSRFERVASQNLIRNRQFFKEISKTFSTCFLDSSAPLGPKCPTYPTQQQPKQGLSFRKRDRKRDRRGLRCGHCGIFSEFLD